MTTSERAASHSDHAELVAATVTVAFWLLAKARLPPPLTTFYNDAAELAVVTALAVIVAAVVKRALTASRSLVVNSVSVLASLTMLCVVGAAVHLVQTHPGRSARSAASDDEPFDVAAAPSSRVEGAPSGGSSGYAEIGDTHRIHIDSDKTYSLSWLPSDPAGENFYAEVQARRTEGAEQGTACTLDFLFGTGSDNVTRYHRMSLRVDGLLIVSNQDGSDRSQVLAGPIALPHVQDLARYHRLAVERRGPDFRFFVDDRHVKTLSRPAAADGGVTFAALDIGFGYKNSATCEFDHFQAWRR